MTSDDLNKQWEDAAKLPLVRETTFDGDFLVLGAETRLAKVGAQVDEAGLAARLAAAHGRAVGPSPLRHVRRAIEKQREGDKALALIHLALSGLAKLANLQNDARRLFLADALMEVGVAPSVIIEGLGLESPLQDEALDKYNPDQPRVHAGSPDGGQWTDGDWLGAATASTTKKPEGVQVADLSGTRGHEVRTDAASRSDNLPVVDAAYQGDFHDTVRDAFADALMKGGNTVLKEVAITLPGDQPMTAKIDILARTQVGYVFGIEVKTGDDPTFTLSQSIVYPHVEAGDIVVSTDKRIGAVILTPGIPWPHVDLFVLYASSPGARLEVSRMTEYMRR
jgi:hypothetical protein